ncbi:hypothetical protein V8E54_008150, partial [Elaphomyces granulatus]
DFDDKELDFLSSNRPMRRYMYFRFIITYLYAKEVGHKQFTERAEARQAFWASLGRYLRRSTLLSLARNMSGVNLPESLYKDEMTEQPNLGDKMMVLPCDWSYN